MLGVTGQVDATIISFGSAGVNALVKSTRSDFNILIAAIASSQDQKHRNEPST
jgi:hypothetical protein